jgi:hypothetical protein
LHQKEALAALLLLPLNSYLNILHSFGEKKQGEERKRMKIKMQQASENVAN